MQPGRRRHRAVRMRSTQMGSVEAWSEGLGHKGAASARQAIQAAGWEAGGHMRRMWRGALLCCGTARMKERGVGSTRRHRTASPGRLEREPIPRQPETTRDRCTLLMPGPWHPRVRLSQSRRAWRLALGVSRAVWLFGLSPLGVTSLLLCNGVKTAVGRAIFVPFAWLGPRLMSL